MCRMALDNDYLKNLRERSKKSHVYQKHQMVGLLLSETLGDEGHKALYIKLAKEHDQEKLMKIAGSIKENMNIKNKGAYFMSVLFSKKSKSKKK